jgi:serine/threonine protein kinase
MPLAAPPAGSGQALPPNMRLAEFEIERVLSESSFGIVYLAVDHALECEVAIKEYLPASLATRGDGLQIVLRSPEHAEAFQRGRQVFVAEARMLARCDHASLLRVHRLFEAQGTVYRVMPYYPAKSLLAARQETQAPDEASLRALLNGLLGALDTLHSAGCLHREVAPGNILLLPENRPVLLDFGAVRRTLISTHAQNLMAGFDPGFANNQQQEGQPDPQEGPWTDLHALGNVMHFCISGHLPWSSSLLAAPVRRQPLAGVVKNLGLQYSAPFLAAINATLAPRPQDRPQSVAEFRALLDGMPTLAKVWNETAAKAPEPATAPAAATEAQPAAHEPAGAASPAPEQVAAPLLQPAAQTPQPQAEPAFQAAAAQPAAAFRVPSAAAPAATPASESPSMPMAPPFSQPAMAAAPTASLFQRPAQTSAAAGEPFFREGPASRGMSAPSPEGNGNAEPFFEDTAAPAAEHFAPPRPEHSMEPFFASARPAAAGLKKPPADSSGPDSVMAALERVLAINAREEASRRWRQRATAWGAGLCVVLVLAVGGWKLREQRMIDDTLAQIARSTVQEGLVTPAPSGVNGSGTNPSAAPAPSGLQSAEPAAIPQAPDTIAQTIQQDPPAAGTTTGSPPRELQRSPGNNADEMAGIDGEPLAAASSAPATGAPSPNAPVAQDNTPEDDEEDISPRKADTSTKKRVAATTSPRQMCGQRTQFALYNCMQRQCERKQWTQHAQCKRLRERGDVD